MSIEAEPSHPRLIMTETGVGDVLALGLALGLIGVLVCGIGWFCTRHRTLIHKSSAP